MKQNSTWKNNAREGLEKHFNHKSIHFVIKKDITEVRKDLKKYNRKTGGTKELLLLAFYDFVLWNFDHRNFGLLFPKFLYYWAKWNV